MVWNESEAGVWLDDFDGAEKVFYNMSQAFIRVGKEHGAVNAVCKIGVQTSALQAPLETLFRDAWKALRFDFPALSVAAEDSKKKYLAATAERVEYWVEETFSVNTVLSAEDIVPTLHLKRLPCLIFLPPSSEVIFHCSHWRIDALGTCMVLDQLFDLVAQGTTAYSPQLDLEYQNLSPSLEDAFGSPRICSPAMEAMAETIRRRNFETSYPSTGLPFNGDMTAEPALSRPQTMEFTAEATRDLIAACKAHGISVTAALHAACAGVVFDQSKHNDHDYSTVVIDKYLRSDHGSVVVERFRLGSAIMTRQPTLYIWTFRGRLTMSLDYNEAYYSTDAVVALLKSIRTSLEKGLRLTFGSNEETNE